MTFKEWLIGLLIKHGMWPKDANTVFEVIKADPANKSMSQRWGDSVEDYPDAIKTVLWIDAKQNALEWIDTNQPQAFYRSMFVA